VSECHYARRRREQRTPSKDGAPDTDLIWEAEERPAKPHMRFSEGRSQNKSSEFLVGYKESRNGSCGVIDLLRNVKRSYARSKSRKRGSTGLSMNYSPTIVCEKKKKKKKSLEDCDNSDLLLAD
jgi:hypothetical protein